MKNIMFNKSGVLADEIELYLACMSNASLVFYEGVKDYLSEERELLEMRRKEISRIEKEADNYLKSIRHKLYSYRLIPDSRGDVIEMLDAMDDLVDIAKQTLLQLCIEQPETLSLFKDDLLEMTNSSLKAVDELVRGVRVFFANPRALDDYVNKVYFHEKEVDRLEEKIKREIFSLPELDLAEKVQGRNIVEKIALISDRSEEIAKNLLLYKIKRSI